MSRHSILNSIASFDAPYILPYESNGNFCRYLPLSEFNWDIIQGLQNSLRVLDVDRHLSACVRDVAAFAALLNEWYNNPSSHFDPLSLQNEAGSLQCRLMHWLSDEQGLSRHPVESALCIAFIIFISLVTDSYDPKSTLHYEAVPRLKDALKISELRNWQVAPQLFLWTLTVGTICSIGSQEQEWFVERIAMAFKLCHVTSYEALHASMIDCSWVSYMLDDDLKFIWLQYSDQ